MNSNSKENNSKGNERSEMLDEIKETGSVSASDGKHKIHCLTIIGEIEGHNVLPEQNKTTKYEHMIPQLVAVEESRDIDGLLIILNTVGGDVEAGLAIAELISGMKKPTVSFVLGGGHSIGIPIAVSCGRSFIVPSATMTIHPVRTSGTILGVPQAFLGLEKMQNRISDFIVGHSGITRETLTRLTFRTDEMATDVGTIIDGKEAVDCGLIDEIGGLREAIAWLKSTVKKEKGEPCHDKCNEQNQDQSQAEASDRH